MKFLNLLVESIEFGIQIFLIGSVIYFWTLYLGGVI